jgi:hypothetical protein
MCGCKDDACLEFEVLISLQIPESVILRAASPEDVLAPVASLRRSKDGGHFESAPLSLLPVWLKLCLPPEYLSEGASENVRPSFELRAPWLSYEQLGSLCKELDRLWNEHASGPILFIWLEWLRMDAWEVLHMTGVLSIVPLSGVDEAVDHRAICNEEDPLDRLLGVMCWKEQMELESQEQCPPQKCDNCGSAVSAGAHVPLKVCGHGLCHHCLALLGEVYSSCNEVASCPVRECHRIIPAEILQQVSDHKKANVNVTNLLGTPLEDAVVFCPRCESIGVDTPVATCGLDLEGVTNPEFCDCWCPSCHWRFCGVCRSPCHPTEACLESRDRAVRMMQRRPPLPNAKANALTKRATAMVETSKAEEAEEACLQLEDSAGFGEVRKAFLSAHGDKVCSNLRSQLGEVKLHPAPLAQAVQDKFMRQLKALNSAKKLLEVRPGLHGTDAKNHQSIFQRGLLIPGEGNQLQVVHGAAFGTGVYVANINAAWLSISFMTQPRILVCGVLISTNVHFHGDAMLVKNSADVIPLFEAVSLSHKEVHWHVFPTRPVIKQGISPASAKLHVAASAAKAKKQPKKNFKHRR